MSNSWDKIPTQSGLNTRKGEGHNPYAFDNKDRHNGKAGRVKRFHDRTMVCQKIIKGRKPHGGKILEYGGFMDSNVYENPLDRVYRNGKWVLITELNEATRNNVARHGITKRDNPAPSKARNKRLEQAEKEAQAIPPRVKRLHAMRLKAEQELFGGKL